MHRTALCSLALLALAGCASDPVPASSGPAPPPPSVGAAPTTSAPSALPSTASSPSRPVPDGVPVVRLAPAEAARLAGLGATGAVDGLRFSDSAGTNVVLLRRRGNEAGGAALLADHVVHPNPQERIVLREVRDGVPECDLDMVADFVPESLRVADSDGDGLAEVSFAYRLNCAGDVSPDAQKLLVLEGGEKHVLRGSASSPYAQDEDPVAEPSPETWPGSAYEDALRLFRQYARG